MKTYKDPVALLLPARTLTVLLPEPMEGMDTVLAKVPFDPVQTQATGFTEIPPIVISSTHV